MSLLTPEELRELRRLHIHVGRRTDALFSGDYRSAVRGRGMEFEEVRAYVPGDDVRHLDWNVTARTGEPFVKIFREERQVTVYLLVDVSGSTHTGSGGRDGRTDRRLQIARVAGGLAYAANQNRDHVGLVTFSDQIEQVIQPRRSRGHGWAIIREVYGAQPKGVGTDVALALKFLHNLQRRRCVIVVISDFLDEGPWASALGTLAHRHQVHTVLVDDPMEQAIGALGLVEIEDAETGETRLVDGAHLAARWGVEHRLKQLRRSGASPVHISTKDDAFQLLHQHFQRHVRKR